MNRHKGMNLAYKFLQSVIGPIIKYKNSVIFIIIVVSTLSAEPELISGDIMIRAGPVTLIEGLQSLLVLTIFSIIVATGLKILNRTFMK